VPDFTAPVTEKVLIEIDVVAAFKARSSSRPHLYHYTFMDSEGKFDCTCEGWKHNAKCWHVEQAAALVSDGSEPVEDFDVSL
jgi:hypothetical protein